MLISTDQSMTILPENGVPTNEDHTSSVVLVREDVDFTEFTKSAPCREYEQMEEETQKEPKDQTSLTTNVEATTATTTTTISNHLPSKYVTPKDFELLTVIGVGSFGR